MLLRQLQEAELTVRKEIAAAIGGLAEHCLTPEEQKVDARRIFIEPLLSAVPTLKDADSHVLAYECLLEILSKVKDAPLPKEATSATLDRILAVVAASRMVVGETLVTLQRCIEMLGTALTQNQVGILF